MRIGIDSRYAEGDLAGIGKYIKYLSTGLAEKGVEIVIFYSQKPKIKIRGENISSTILPHRNRYFFEQIGLVKALKEEKIDLYHAAGNIGIPWRCPIPSVLTVHDIIPLATPGYFNYSKWPFLSRASYFLRIITSCWKADRVITDTNFVKQQLIDKLKIRGEKIAIVNLGVEALPGRKELPGKIAKRKYILNHGGIDRRKNLETLIKVFSKIREEFPELKLVITGENPNLKPKLEKLAKDLGLYRFVVFPGYVDEEVLWSFIRNAALICFPSLTEGFGAPVLEGFAAGTPVICSNTTSLPEIAGEAAVLVDPKDEKVIAEGIKKLLTDKGFTERLIKKGLTWARSFTWEKTVSETLKIYHEVINKANNNL